VRILNAEPAGYDDVAREVLGGVGEVVESPLGRHALLAELSKYDVLIVRLGHQIDREMIDAGRRLKAIATATTGLDHIDVDYAERRGIAVLSLRGETEFLQTVSATAEHTWALLLALVRRVPQAADSVLRGEWDRDRFRGHDLDGKTLGIVGLGRVGSKVAGYGLAFGMKVVAFDPFAAQWPRDVARCLSLTELLQRVDVVSLHVPLDGDSSGMIGERELKQLRSGAVVVNTSRAELVEESALVQALEKGELAGAALDFVAHERDSEQRLSSPLISYARSHDNLIITPHVGGATKESMAKTEIFMARKLVSFLSAPPPPERAPCRVKSA
jgi:D-3-phosphoglycerate dehydrogenase